MKHIWFYLASATLLVGRLTKRTVLGIVALHIVVGALKTATHIRRPNGTDFLSFPSGHAATAWYLATIWSFNPFVTLWATAVSALRVIEGWHTPLDVLAGGLLGFIMAKSL